MKITHAHAEPEYQAERAVRNLRGSALKDLLLPVAACGLALVLAGCAPMESGVPPGGGGGTPPPSGQYNQTIGLTTANGSRETIVQTFTPDVTPEGKTRICLTNRKNGQRELFHNHTPPINPFRLGLNGRDCATFPANSRVVFSPVAANQPVRPDKTLTYSTNALAGGRLDLVWQ